jgi:Photosynthesis system II assembly factor YCF48
MNEVPKIVHQRLRVATPARELLEQTHPDADVLTAFSEQSLAAPEREGVLQHLALCADCRDVVALALPEMSATLSPMEEEREVVGERVAAEQRQSRFSWASLSWTHLRWATLAAGIAVAVFVVRPGLERMGNPRTAVNSPANELPAPAAQPLFASPGAGSKVTSSAQAANSVAASLVDESAAMRPSGKRTEAERAENAAPNGESEASAAGAKSTFLADPRARLSPLPGMQLARNMAAADGNTKQRGDAKKDSLSAGVPDGSGVEYGSLTAAKTLRADKSAVTESTAGNSSTTVEVAAGAELVSTEGAPSSDASLMARADGLAVQNAPKIEKAKPALDQTTRDAAVGGGANELQKRSAPAALASPSPPASQAETKQAEVIGKPGFIMKAAAAPAMMPTQSASWTIADGVLQRSLDGGHTWQMAARTAQTLLCYSNRGQEVWAGGQAGTLLHSADNGATWSAVAVSFNGQQLSSDVTQLDVRLIHGPVAQITLSTENHETWSSSDGGKTWKRK